MLTDAHLETITISSEQSDKDGVIKSRKARDAWKKMSNILKATRKILPLEEKETTRRDSDFLDHSFMTRFSSVTEKQSGWSGLSAFRHVHGIPIKDSERGESFSSQKLIINPERNILVAWLGLVAIAFIYYAWSLIARQAFTQLQDALPWITIDYMCDVIFVIDIIVQMRTGFLEDGLLVIHTKKVAKRYLRSKQFIADIISLIPLNLITSSIPLLGFPRFIKIYRAKQFYRKIEWATPSPTTVRVVNLIHTLLLIVHWFACLYFIISESEGFSTLENQRGWSYPLPPGQSEWNTLRRKYLHSLYWSCLTLTMIGEKQSPNTDVEYVCTLAAYFLGIFVFATVVGQVGNVIANQNENKQSYRRMMDNAKSYMKSKHIPKQMQFRVMRWYEYSRSRGTLNGSDDISSLYMMPDSLKTELAIFVNLSTLRKVSIFRLVQPEFLNHLVLKMKSYIFTPGDVVCRYGEVAREMYIVNHGVLEVVSKEGVVVKRLKTGDFFGEIGILNLSGGVNKRVANVRSVGYSEVFTLHGEDVLQAMEYYPEAKQLLHLYGRKRFEESTSQSTTQSPIHSSNKQIMMKVEEEPEIPHFKDGSLKKMAEVLAASNYGISFNEITKSQVTEKELKRKESIDDVRKHDDVTEMNKFMKLFAVIFDEYSKQETSSDKTIKRLKEEIKEKDDEIIRLQEDVKLLMDKLEESEDR